MTAAQHRLQLAAIRVHEAALSSERVAQQRMKQTDAKWKVASCIEVDLNVRAGANLVIDFSQSRKACLARYSTGSTEEGARHCLMYRRLAVRVGAMVSSFAAARSCSSLCTLRALKPDASASLSTG